MDDNNKIETITLYNNPDSDIFPEKDLPENARLLRGFEWRGDERIKSKDDIYQLMRLKFTILLFWGVRRSMRMKKGTGDWKY